MTKSFDPQLVVTRSEVLFSWVVNDEVERIRVPRDLIDLAQRRPFRDGEAWVLIENRMAEIGEARTRGAATEDLDWFQLLGPRDQ